MITLNVTLNNVYEIQNVKQTFNPGLALIGHSGTGPRSILTFVLV